jgi:hypothetical protein
MTNPLLSTILCVHACSELDESIKEDLEKDEPTLEEVTAAIKNHNNDEDK